MCGNRTSLALTAILVHVLGVATANDATNRGLQGEYFNIQWWYGTPTVTRIDPEINFEWGSGPPAPGVNPNNFSIRWTGDLEVPLTDVYTFTLRTNGRVVLRIGDKAVISESTLSTTDCQGKIELTAGTMCPMELTYSTILGKPSVQLLWENSTQPQEIVPAAVLQLPLRARTPAPADGATEVLQDATLQWEAGCRASRHDIYFDDDANAVANATPATQGTYRGRQMLGETAFRPGPLEWGKTYYWRVDEANDGEPERPWKGPVWHFTTADFLLIDDFESYTDLEGHYMWDTWIDGWFNGTGSLVGYILPGEFPAPHGGKQFMPFDYNNAVAPYYSEACRTWDKPQDWTVCSITDLSLWIMGRPVPLLEKPDRGIILGVPGLTSEWGGPSILRFGYGQLRGDGQIVAKVEALRSNESAYEAGVMLRETPASGSKYVAVGIQRDKTLSLGRRLIESGSSTWDDQGSASIPHWLKLTRRGDTLTAQHSEDGTTWEDIADSQGQPIAVTVALPDTVCIGLYLIGRTWKGTAIAEFSGVTFTGDVSALWQVTESDWGGNPPDSLYVALEDAAGHTAAVMHPDRAAVNLADWTPWRIPLRWFATAGVDLKSIRRMYIGVGDRNSPQPNGSGRIWIDDIRVVRPASP